MTKNSQKIEKSESRLIEEVSEEFRISNIKVRNYISLLDLPKKLQNSIENKLFLFVLYILIFYSQLGMGKKQIAQDLHL